MQDVSKDREKFIGGSDIPVILGISTFKTRWQLLQEKAGIIENDFSGNEYTEYGNIMEPKIRDYVNQTQGLSCEEARFITRDLRAHLDGYDPDSDVVLEIKTTSQIHEDVSGYKKYLAQLAFYMDMADSENGILAVYERPEDFDKTFLPERLKQFQVSIADVRNLLDDEIYPAIDRFREDLKKLKENPFLTEEELLPFPVIANAELVIKLEEQLVALKDTENALKQAKSDLKKAMEDYHIKTWEMPSGTKITLIPDGQDTIVESFNAEKFKAENPELYGKYVEEKKKKGKAGYVRITVK